MADSVHSLNIHITPGPQNMELILDLSQTDLDLLECVRQQQGLDNIDQVAEWLLKQRLRYTSLKLTGRNTALSAVIR